jgi:diaminohydroxyphosphoribosylaminopyrimidine deaminase/5-amino-6-(5-phosphoribosylamino)uracil reductase
MIKDIQYMKRCLELAALGYTKSNPKVGCVIVYRDEIIGEGYHEMFGEAHAEVNAFNSVQNKELIKNATIYVSLEPCSFHGKTGACTRLFQSNPCKKVVIGVLDPNPKVAGNGVAALKAIGIEVVTGVLEEECKAINQAFFFSVGAKRPYTIAKWAQSADGYLGLDRKRTKISNELVDTKTQLWRSQVDAYLIGHQTLIIDQPLLNSRLVPKNQPLRCVIGNNIQIDGHFFEFNSPILLFGDNKTDNPGIETYPSNQPQQILDYLYTQNIGQLMLEGGTYTIQRFIDANLVQEIRRIINPNLILEAGTNAPTFSQFKLIKTEKIKDQLIEYWQK